MEHTELPTLDKEIRSTGSTIDLFWIPLGAGSRVVQTSGRIFEMASAALQRRDRYDLYHAALLVHTPKGDIAIEQAPVPDRNGASRRGVVAEGPVGSKLLGRFRIFRYEVRCWRDGSIPDLVSAVDSPVELSDDPIAAERIVSLLPTVPTMVWGRDEARTGDMWNSNSVISWILTRSGIAVDGLSPPLRGRAPGWDAGKSVALRCPVLDLADRSADLVPGAGAPVPTRDDRQESVD